MRPPGAPDQLEQRRRLAVQRLQAGQPMSAVARQMQASVSSVWRWWQTYQRAGPRGLRPRPTQGDRRGCPRASCARWSGSWHGGRAEPAEEFGIDDLSRIRQALTQQG